MTKEPELITLPSVSGIEQIPVTAHASRTAIASKTVSHIRDLVANGKKGARGFAEFEAIEGFVRWAPGATGGSLTKAKPLERMASIKQPTTSGDFR